ncbi:MAG: hypothetical protein GF350_13325 [Chitinivibrionales bacterium]|nr:hypothetical protein [Chitinivibrionales bacterium]
MKQFTVSLLMTACMLFAAENAPVISLQTNNGSPSGGDQIKIIVMIKDVTNLDTYSIDIAYDSDVFALERAVIDDPFAGLHNVLRSGKGKIIPVIKKGEGKVNISATLTGTEPTGTIAEERLAGILLLSVKNAGKGKVEIVKSELLDNKRGIIKHETGPELIFNKGEQ